MYSKKDFVEVRMTSAVCVHLLYYMFLLRAWNKRPADSSTFSESGTP